MPQVGKAPTVKVKYLAAPNLAVGAVAGAVQGKAQSRFGQLVLRQYGGSVGNMVLHLHIRRIKPVGGIARVQVCYHFFCRKAVKGGEALYIFLIGSQAIRVVQVAKGLGQKHIAPGVVAEGGF